MIERKFVQIKKDEFTLKEFVKEELGKGKISEVTIERTPVGEKILVKTSRPGLIIGRRGEKVTILTDLLKRRFGLENPHIEIEEISHPDLDANNVADEIASSLERFGSMRFKIIAYKMLQRIKSAGALGAEIRLSGKLPSERAKSWRFAFGYLKKTGEPASLVHRATAVAQTIPGSIGVKVEITPLEAAEEKVDTSKKIIVEQVIEPEEKEENHQADNKNSKKEQGGKN